MGEELTPEELQPLLEAEAERSGEPADQSILEATAGPVGRRAGESRRTGGVLFTEGSYGEGSLRWL